MPRNALSHDDCLALVCAVCTNLHGKKARRRITESEAGIIGRKVFSSYQKGNPSFPQGICTTCENHLRQLKKEEMEEDSTWQADGVEGGLKESNETAVKLLLPDDYHCFLPHQTRSIGLSTTTCTCRWCVLARVNGPNFLQWRKEKLKSQEQTSKICRICQECGKGIPLTQQTHVCCSSDLDTVKNMLENIPQPIKGKLAHALIKELEGESSLAEGSLTLPAPQGGKPMQIKIGTNTHPQELTPLTHTEAVKMTNRAGISGAAQTSILADLRAKWGRKVVEPGLQLAMPVHNHQFASFFTVEKKKFSQQTTSWKKNTFSTVMTL